jgi:hypothetical protein
MKPYDRSEPFRRRQGSPPRPADLAIRIGLLFAVALAIALAAQLGFGRGSW